MGNGQVTGVRLHNRNTDELTDLEAGGVFVAIGHTPNTSIFEGQLEMTEDYIAVHDPRPRRASTACSPRATWSTTSTARPSRRRAWAARRPWTRNATSRPWATSRSPGRLRPKSPRRRPDRRPPPLRVVRAPRAGPGSARYAGHVGGARIAAVLALLVFVPGVPASGGARRNAAPLPGLVPAGDRGGFTFPVARSNWLSVVEFGDDWHDPRFRLVDGRWLLGGYHEGNDILAEEGTPVLAATSGTVEAVRWTFYSGTRVGVRGDDGKYYFYAHMSRVAPNTGVGSAVDVGEVLGLVVTRLRAAGDGGRVHPPPALRHPGPGRVGESVPVGPTKAVPPVGGGDLTARGPADHGRPGRASGSSTTSGRRCCRRCGTGRSRDPGWGRTSRSNGSGLKRLTRGPAAGTGGGN